MTAEIKLTCLEGGKRHAWKSLGLDVKNDKLVTVKRCLWCSTEQARRYAPRLRSAGHGR